MARSASPSKATASEAPVRDSGLLDGFEMQGAAVEIDVAAVGSAVEGDDFSAEAGKKPRGENRGRTVAAIDDDADA
jgi:hypothetical protein